MKEILDFIQICARNHDDLAELIITAERSLKSIALSTDSAEQTFLAKNALSYIHDFVMPNIQKNEQEMQAILNSFEKNMMANGTDS